MTIASNGLDVKFFHLKREITESEVCEVKHLAIVVNGRATPCIHRYWMEGGHWVRNSYQCGSNHLDYRDGLSVDDVAEWVSSNVPMDGPEVLSESGHLDAQAIRNFYNEPDWPKSLHEGVA